LIKERGTQRRLFVEGVAKDGWVSQEAQARFGDEAPAAQQEF
jgi:hypothetical protein